MGGIERLIVLGALMYMALYIPFFAYGCYAAATDSMNERLWIILVPLHIIGMILNLIALIVTIRDVYLRPFRHENDKLTWILVILFTGGIGWIVYIFRHALKPRILRVSEE